MEIKRWQMAAVSRTTHDDSDSSRFAAGVAGVQLYVYMPRVDPPFTTRPDSEVRLWNYVWPTSSVIMLTHVTRSVSLQNSEMREGAEHALENRSGAALRSFPRNVASEID